MCGSCPLMQLYAVASLDVHISLSLWCREERGKSGIATWDCFALTHAQRDALVLWSSWCTVFAAPQQLACVAVCSPKCRQAKQTALCSPPLYTLVPFVVALPSGRFEKCWARACCLGSAATETLVQSLFKRQELQLPILPLGTRTSSCDCQDASLMQSLNFFFLWIYPITSDLLQTHAGIWRI